MDVGEPEDEIDGSSVDRDCKSKILLFFSQNRAHGYVVYFGLPFTLAVKLNVDDI